METNDTTNGRTEPLTDKNGCRGLPKKIEQMLEDAAPDWIKNHKGFGNNNLHTIWNVASAYGYREALATKENQKGGGE